MERHTKWEIRYTKREYAYTTTVIWIFVHGNKILQFCNLEYYLWDQNSGNNCAFIVFLIKQHVCRYSIWCIFDRWDTTSDIATISFPPVPVFSHPCCAGKSIPLHSLIWSSHLFFGEPLFFPFTEYCILIFKKPEDLDIWQQKHLFPFLNP